MVQALLSTLIIVASHESYVPVIVPVVFVGCAAVGVKAQPLAIVVTSFATLAHVTPAAAIFAAGTASQLVVQLV